MSLAAYRALGGRQAIGAQDEGTRDKNKESTRDKSKQNM